MSARREPTRTPQPLPGPPAAGRGRVQMRQPRQRRGRVRRGRPRWVRRVRTAQGPKRSSALGARRPAAQGARPSGAPTCPRCCRPRRTCAGPRHPWSPSGASSPRQRHRASPPCGPWPPGPRPGESPSNRPGRPRPTRFARARASCRPWSVPDGPGCPQASTRGGVRRWSPSGDAADGGAVRPAPTDAAGVRSGQVTRGPTVPVASTRMQPARTGALVRNTPRADSEGRRGTAGLAYSRARHSPAKPAQAGASAPPRAWERRSRAWTSRSTARSANRNGKPATARPLLA